MTQLIICFAAIAAATLYAAACEYRAKNHRDARLLAGVGAGGLLASLGGWVL